jgi:multiple sugar transport system substrate-binding protein
VATVVALSIALTACASQPSGGDTLSINSQWTSGTPQGDALKATIARFEDSTGIKVKLVETGDPLSDTWETDVAGGKATDLVLTNVAENVVDWVKNGAVVAADSYLEDWGLTDKIREDAVSEWRDSNGDLIGFPYTGFIWPTWYNTDLLKSAGVDQIPATTDELLDAVAKLRAAGIQPVAIAGGDWNGQKLFMQISQMYATPDEAKEAFSDGKYCSNADIKKGVQLFIDLRDAGAFIDDAEGYQFEAQSNAYYTKEAAIMPSGSWAFTEAPEDVAASTELGGFPIPADSTFDKPAAYNGWTSTGLMISQKGVDSNLENIRKFVEFMYEPESVTAFADNDTVVAATTAGDAEISNPLLQQANTSLSDKVQYAVMPDTYVPAAVADPFIVASSQAFGPGVDIDTVCAAIDSAYAAQ